MLSVLKSYGAEAVAIQADVHDPAFGKKIVAASSEQLNTDVIDILVNNATSTDINQYKPLEAIDIEAFRSIMQANLFSALGATMAVLPLLPVSGGGRVINISSVEARDASSNPTVLYGASKAALDQLTRSMAKIYGKDKKCTINSVSIGPTETEALKRYLNTVPDEVGGILERLSIEQRLASVDDIAPIVAFFGERGKQMDQWEYCSCIGGLSMVI